MKNFRVRLAVSLNDGMLDPQGEAIARTLQEMTEEVDGVRVGKLIEIDLRAPDVEHARSAVESMSEQLLTHPVTEQSEIVGEIVELKDS